MNAFVASPSTVFAFLRAEPTNGALSLLRCYSCLFTDGGMMLFLMDDDDAADDDFVGHDNFSW